MGLCKIKLFLCLINYALCHKDICGSGGIALGTDGGEWSASHPSRFNPGKEPPVGNG
jgi:hypothetical protein